MGNVVCFKGEDLVEDCGAEVAFHQFPVQATVLGFEVDVVSLADTDNVAEVGEGDRVGAGYEVFGLKDDAAVYFGRAAVLIAVGEFVLEEAEEAAAVSFDDVLAYQGLDAVFYLGRFGLSLAS